MKTTRPDLTLKLPEVVAQFDRSLQSAPQRSHHTHSATSELPHPTRHYVASTEYVPILGDVFEDGFARQSYVCASQLLLPTSHAKAGR